MARVVREFTTIKDGNLAYHVNDNKRNVDKNRQDLSSKYNFDLKNLRFMNQIHKDNIQIVTNKSENLIDSCDALITNEKNLPLLVMVADCIPILLFDEVKNVISAIHAGRNSTFMNITKKCALKMIEEFGCEPKNIKAILGPSIQKCCYEVSEELAQIVETSFGKEFVDGRLIDLQGINKKQLEEVGVKDIEITDICTKCNGNNYFSYRRDKNCGRFAGLIIIED